MGEDQKIYGYRIAHYRRIPSGWISIGRRGGEHVCIRPSPLLLAQMGISLPELGRLSLRKRCQLLRDAWRLRRVAQGVRASAESES